MMNTEKLAGDFLSATQEMIEAIRARHGDNYAHACETIFVLAQLGCVLSLQGKGEGSQEVMLLTAGTVGALTTFGKLLDVPNQSLMDDVDLLMNRFMRINQELNREG